MKKEQITDLLAHISGKLQIQSPQEIKAVEALQASLAKVLLRQEVDSDQFKNLGLKREFTGAKPLKKTFQIDKSRLKGLVSKAKPSAVENELYVQMHNTDFANLITQQPKEGLGDFKITEPLAGARIAKSDGPFKTVDGFGVKFDFFKVRKLNSIYIKGQTLPAILFNTEVSIFDFLKSKEGTISPMPFGDVLKKVRYTAVDPTVSSGRRTVVGRKSAKGKPTIDVSGGVSPLVKAWPFDKVIKDIPLFQGITYTLSGNTIWVNAKLLCPTAPDGHYCGLRIKSGTVTLSDKPEKIGDKLTVETTVTISVNVNLEQKVVEENDGSDPFGVDSRNAEYTLPTAFAFTIKNTTKEIRSVGDIHCKVYGQDYSLKYENAQNVEYEQVIGSITIPMNCNKSEFSVLSCKSPFVELDGKASIESSAWALPTTPIDIAKPLEADGNGMLEFTCAKGLTGKIRNTDEEIGLSAPFIFLGPGMIAIFDEKSNGAGQYRKVDLWKDDLNPFGSTLEIKYMKDGVFVYAVSDTEGEKLAFTANLDFQLDRPLKVDGMPIDLSSKPSYVFCSGSKEGRKLQVIGINVSALNLPGATPNIEATPSQPVKPIAFALENALFTVSPPFIVALNGNYDPEFLKIFNADLATSYRVLRYTPTLPDPYAADLTVFEFPNERIKYISPFVRGLANLWLVNNTQWAEDGVATTAFSFSAFGPFGLLMDNVAESGEGEPANTPEDAPQASGTMVSRKLMQRVDPSRAEAYESYNMSRVDQKSDSVERALRSLGEGQFTLLDVSSRANQFGIRFSGIGDRRDVDQVANGFPMAITGMEVTTAGTNAQAFTVPQISWEPFFNLSAPAPPAAGIQPKDPQLGFNYFANDGLYTAIGNLNPKHVPLSPIPMTKYLVDVHKEDNITYAIFNLPFGMMAFSVLDKDSNQNGEPPTIENISPVFNDYLAGGIQLELTAGTSLSPEFEDNLFKGYTVQMMNALDFLGNYGDYSTLGSSGGEIFNREFHESSSNDDEIRPGVPLTKIGFSGYGASIFSDWYNKDAAFAETSQATFNVVTGRTAHEVVQVKSVIYPWGIFVVRTITLIRLNNGYIARIDSGWQAESDGKFHFNKAAENSPYEMHPGLVKGLYNIRNIRENELSYEGTTEIKIGDLIFDGDTNTEKPSTKNESVEALLRGLTFDADIEIEGVTEGAFKDLKTGKMLVPSEGALGFVQLAPRGTPINPKVFESLLAFQDNTIGAPVNCTIKIADTDQHVKVNRVDVNNSVDSSDEPIFVGAARGSVVLPKEGSWTMVTHNAGDGTVTPLPANLSVPLIRIGKWQRGKAVNAGDAIKNLIRVANPTELLRIPGPETINFGFLQNLNTQKVLFLTPSFKKGEEYLLSKTPPLFADSYRLLQTTGIFPGIGDAVTDFGAAMVLLKDAASNAPIFSTLSGVQDGAQEVFKLLKVDVKAEAGKIVDQGYELLKTKVDGTINKALNFDLPPTYPLIDTEEFKIRIDYSAEGTSRDYSGLFDYSLESFATKLEDQWRGRLNNVSMVVSLGPFDDLMRISGNFNAEKGKESNIGGPVSAGNDILPTPVIKFSDAIEPVIQILDILAKLSTGDYKGALNDGLKVAMSNNANIWEYKFEATKELPLIKFPPGPAYDAPQAPLKLEAQMSLGVYFNAALKVTSDPTQLLPTAGAFFNFHGGLQVMCVTVGGATIYAVGNADLKLAADTTKVSLTMKFGFGAQIGVGLPVIGNVSILFLVGVEIYYDSTQVVIVTAFMYFRGHAELAGGLVGVTITIEANGSIIKNPGENTQCAASVSFGLDISVCFIINISFHESWEENRQIA